MQLKVYVVQQQREDGTLDPNILACKLRHADAHLIARAYAPARVTPLVADKTPEVNGSTNSSRGGSSYGFGRNFSD